MTAWYGPGSVAERVAVEFLYRSGISRAAARWHAGRGAIYMFHSVVPDRTAHLNPDLRTSPLFLDRLLANLRAADIDILSIGDLADRLQPHDKRRFVVITFDDGYADNLTHALPIFEKYAAPLTAYVSTGMVTRTLNCWWIALERLFLKHSAVELPAMGRKWVFSRFADRALAYREACEWVCCDVRSRTSLLSCSFARYGLSMPDINNDIGLSLDQLKELARHPLVTIGGHTTSHPNLAQLPEAEARREIVDNKEFLEPLVGKPVEHFAYPFGGASTCGAREGRLAREAGYKTAVTTRHACITERDLQDIHQLPRVGINRSYESIGLARLQIDGATSALLSLRRHRLGSLAGA